MRILKINLSFKEGAPKGAFFLFKIFLCGKIVIGSMHNFMNNTNTFKYSN